MKPSVTLVCLLLPLPVMAAQVSDVILSAGYTLDDNVTRAEQTANIEKDTILSARVRGTYRLPLNQTSNLAFTGDIQHQAYQDFERLSRNTFTLGARYNIQTAFEFTSPWYFLGLNLSLENVDADPRDANVIDLQLGIGKRLTDRTKVVATFTRQNHDADNDTFDTRMNRVAVNLDLRTHNRNLAYATLAYTDGDIVVTAAVPYPASLSGLPHILDTSSYPNLSAPWTYNLSAKTVSLAIGDNYTIAGHQFVDINLLLYRADADRDFVYNGSLLQLNYFYQF